MKSFLICLIDLINEKTKEKLIPPLYGKQILRLIKANMSCLKIFE